MTVDIVTKPAFAGARVLITGGTGSWGYELTRQLLRRDVERVTIFSRGELAQVKMAREFRDDRLNFHIGDVRDRKAVDDAMRHNADLVFHLAALKHVPVCEDHPREAILTNIIGTQNVCDAAIANGVDRVIDVSTDKAVAPTNLYGMTKAVGEKLVSHADRGSRTKFICIRGGNAMGSNGSAIPLFISQVERNNEITLTHAKMTRYFMSIERAVSLIFKATELGVGGETFVTRMPAFLIQHIAEVIAEHYGDGSTSIREIGIRPGEKLDEVLISKDEARLSFELDDDYYVIAPQSSTFWTSQHSVRHSDDIKPFEMEEYSSSTFISSKDQARQALEEGGFLK
jgi:FlaA1/EpsC-like NDP-sugar epimerase